MDKCDFRWRGAIAGGGERSQVDASDRRWRGAIAGGGERSQVEGSDRKWRGAIAGGGELWKVEGSDRKWMRAIAGGGERSQVEEGDNGLDKTSKTPVTAVVSEGCTIEQARKSLQINTERDTGIERGIGQRASKKDA